MKALKAFIKPFEAPKRSAKEKKLTWFFSSSGIGTGRAKSKKITNNLANPYFISATFRTWFLSPFSSFKARDNSNVQCHDQEESKLNSTINANSGAHTKYTWQNNNKSIQ